MFNNKRDIFLVKGVFTGKYWLENAAGKRLTPKFFLDGKQSAGKFVMLHTSVGVIVYNNRQSEILHKEYEAGIRSVMYKVTDKVYCLQKLIDSGKCCELYNPDGERLSKDEFFEVYHLGDGCIAICTASKVWGIVDEELNWLVAPQYEQIYMNECNCIVGICENKTDIITIDNFKIVSKISIDGCFAEHLTNNVYLFTKDNKFGVVKNTGEIIVPIQYDRINTIKISGREYFLVRLAGLEGLLDVNGKVCAECIYFNLEIKESRVIGVKRQILETVETIWLE